MPPKRARCANAVAVPRAAAPPLPDLRDVKGQAAAKRALEIAAAGELSLLMVGPPGTGKSMLAQRLAGLLPELSHEAALESAAIQSVAGTFSAERWGQRVLRAPHHTASAAALVGGGSPPRPGEASLAHHGVLFLDELPEFPRAALEALREPIETGRIVISRAARQADFPARFQLVAAMNPCPCGQLGNPAKSCRCTPDAVLRYQARISGPLARPHRCAGRGARSRRRADRRRARRRDQRCGARTRRRRAGACRGAPGLRQRAPGGRSARPALPARAEASRFLQGAAVRLGWSARGFHRVLRIARTIADLAASLEIDAAHLGEAIQYRRVLQAA